MTTQKGFTLLETMVALAITATVLLAGSRAMNSLILSTERQREVILAHICAENALIQTKLERRYPALGSEIHSCRQIDQVFDVTVQVLSTANPGLRRIKSEVGQNGVSIISLSTVIGRY